MNVLLAVPWDQETGGVAFVVGHVARHLERAGHSVHFLHPAERRWPARTTTKWGFSGWQANLRSPRSPGTVRSRLAFALTFPITLGFLLWLILRHRIDVVNVHYPSAMFGYFAVCRRMVPRLRLVVSVHGTDLLSPDGTRKALDPLLDLLLRSADSIVAPSNGFAQQCELPAELSPALHVIHNGVDRAEFSRRTNRRPNLVLTVASLDVWKGLDVLIRAFARARHEHDDLALVVAGDGPERASLEKLAREVGLEGAVAFLGYVDRPTLTRLMAMCTVFVLPSRSEPFGIAIVEALAAGAPVIATRVGGIPEILDDGTVGILVPPDDERALAESLVRLLHDAELRRVLSTRGPARVSSAFLWSLTGRRYLSLFERLLDASDGVRIEHRIEALLQ